MNRLFDFQRNASAECFAHLGSGRRPLLCLPTGAGKTEVAIATAARLSNSGRRVVFVADRTALVENFEDRISERGLDAAVQSVQEFGLRSNHRDYDVAVIDEAHDVHQNLLLALGSWGKGYMGLTATPFSPSLPNWYDAIVSGPTTGDMMRDGRLTSPTLRRDHSFERYGEYRIAIENAGRLRGPVMAFVPSRDLKAAHEAFMEAGYPTRYVRSGEPNLDAIEAFKDGKAQVLLSIQMLSRGFDHPEVRHVMDFQRQGTQSFNLHIQKVGRGQRVASGKSRFVFHDYVGNWERFKGRRERFYAEGVQDWADVARYRRA